MDGGTTQAWIALGGTIFGGAGLKIFEQFLGRSKQRDDTATSLRDELRKELAEARDEAEEYREEADVWRLRYYSLVASVVTGNLADALRQINDNKKSE